MTEELRRALVERFRALNGEHLMTPEDDAYVTNWCSTLDQLAAESARDVDELARLVLAGTLPLPSYVTSAGTPMFQRDLLALAEQAGGIEKLPSWFGAHYDDSAAAVVAWNEYLSGQLVCLREVTPQTMKRKDALVAEISELLAQGEREAGWLDRLHERVDELDELEPPFAPYDRLRFGGPVSRDRLVNEVRERFPRSAPVSAMR